MDRDDAVRELLVVAGAAHDVAAGLNKFLVPVAEDAVEIKTLISKCFAVSSSLHGLASAIGRSTAAAAVAYGGIARPTAEVTACLDHTFKDVHQIVGEGLGDAKRAKVSVSTAYRKVWRNINQYFQGQSRNTLSRRLEYCCLLLDDLTRIIYEGHPRDLAMFHDMAARVSKLLDVQEARIRPAGIDWPESDTPSTPSSAGPNKKKPSFERKRPPETLTKSPKSKGQSKGKARPSAQGRQSSMESSGSSRPRPRPPPPPPAPEVPFSDSSTEYSNDSSTSQSTVMTHWLPKIFERSPPSTKLAETGQPSKCFDDDNPDALYWLQEDDYIKLMEIPFENGDLIVDFYLRLRDGRARILCETIRPRRQEKECTVCLTNLNVSREGQFLKFKRISNNPARAGLWASLRFPSYEKIVLFFCTFLALRSQDNGDPIQSFSDWKLHREEEVFKAEIIDDQYHHGLMVLRDRDSGGIRLQASVYTGSLKKMPVWTAFITHQIHSRKWIRLARPGSCTVLLADLYRYLFDNEYSPPISPGGEHDLTFVEPDDAEDFLNVIEELVERAEEDEDEEEHESPDGRFR